MLLKSIIFIFSLIYFLNATQVNNAPQKQIGVYENLGATLPLDLTFFNEYNTNQSLKQYISNTPTIITLNYFTCPSLCSPLLIGVADMLNKMDLKPYIDYKVLTISIDPNDTPKSALEKKKNILSIIKKDFPPQTWSFLTSNQKNIYEITDKLGFKYEKRVKDGVVDYLHAGMIIVISPNGKIIRYLNGTDFLPFDVKLAIYEAKEERTGSTIAKTLLYCFAYDAKSKTYVFQAEKIIGTLILLIVISFFIYLIKTGRKKGDDHE